MLTQARLEICRRHPFLAASIAHLEPVLSENYFPAAVDGRRFFCHPQQIKRAEPLLFHGLCHCLLGHIFQRNVSALACDIAAALLVNELAPEYFPAGHDPLFGELRRRTLGEFRGDHLDELILNDPFFMENRDAISSIVSMDEHRLWNDPALLPRLASASGEGDFWRAQAKRITLGSGSKNIGCSPGVHREKMTLGEGARHEFAQYLRHYAVEREYAREDMETFQYPWYAYGLERYENMPLIEPEESRVERRLEELVIAIDTSGSCERGLTRQFLEQTRNILLRENLFFQRFNLHIMQCDAKLQRDEKITTIREFERYIANLEVCGGGGTNFCPVFERIDHLIAKGEFRNLRGMLYFTDGRGIYPPAPPKYEATFVFLRHRYDDIDTPLWAKRLILDAPMPRGNEYMEY